MRDLLRYVIPILVFVTVLPGEIPILYLDKYHIAHCAMHKDGQSIASSAVLPPT